MCGCRCAPPLTPLRAQDPFGGDANDLPVIKFHRHFCASLDQLLDEAWMLEDHWVVPTGVSARARAPIASQSPPPRHRTGHPAASLLLSASAVIL